MKTNLFLKSSLFAAIILSGCVSINEGVTQSQTPLHQTLNTVKSELRAVRRVMTERPQDYALSCDGVSAPGMIEFSSIVVDLGISETNSAGANAGAALNPGGLGVSLGADTSQSTSGGSSLSVRMTPMNVPVGDENDVVRTGGVAEALLGMMRELAEVDDTRPCLDLGGGPLQPSAVLRLSFSAETRQSASGGADIVFLRVGSSRSKSNRFSNSITLNVFLEGRALTLQ